jgi:monovalent cation:H+ antiporter-2, CPA2 family
VHEEPQLIALIAIGLALAVVGGYIAVSLRLSPIIGYLLAGIAVGPRTPGFVGDAELAHQVAEIGVILLMFGVGQHFSIKELWEMRTVALPGAFVQIGLVTVLTAVITLAWGWSFRCGLVFGLALSVASTVVLIRALESQGAASSPDGKIAIAWLIVEDLAMVLALVLLPAFAGAPGGEVSDAAHATHGIWLSLGIALGKVALFIALMLLLGARFFPWVLARIERTGSREMFTLTVAAMAIATAYGSAKLFGVSFALGAFFAGVVINESNLSKRAAADLQPFQDAFGVLFFVAVGMMFDPAILLHEPLRVLIVVAIIIVGKSLCAIGVVLVLRRPLSTALMVSAALAQIGEFSFILAALAVQLGIITLDVQNLILAGALISITLNPLVFYAVKRFQRVPAIA